MITNDIGITIIVVTLLILLMIAGIIITMFVSNRRNVQQEMKMTQMQVDYEKELRKVEDEVQEQVLANIGRELHDNIGQLLRVTLMQVDQQKITNPGTGTLMQAASETLTHTIEEVRRLSKSLNTDLLDVQGLANTMQQDVNRLQQLNKYNLTWECDGEPALKKDQKVIVFRIFQEITNNILKHSEAKNIDILLSGKYNFRLVVKEDGKGFDLDKMMRSATGSGLKNMIRRADLAKLKCHIDTAIDKGTTFTLEQIT